MNKGKNKVRFYLIALAAFKTLSLFAQNWVGAAMVKRGSFIAVFVSMNMEIELNNTV